ncbi:hypothetical protein GCM10009841_31360 [Microlunatus panaciterrae]|uniref:Membrane protein n=1 Tax=Microlunatus panaciterrae TaxID=400768 RepID=A0ABS2RFM1_9ACTN|nr:hypothetical protein [Microlunatus panaciterrae]MBM7797796.1 putative membrane protein [Microlunatus panaciterrae]
MGLLFLLLLLAAFLFLRRNMAGGRPPWLTPRSAPEDEAKRVLSERFARGDISSDEFLERASVLNWTPGTNPWAERPKKKRF